jgi:hypothetical protein
VLQKLCPHFTNINTPWRRGLCSRHGRVLVDDGSCVAVPQRAKPRGDCVRRERCCRRPYRQVEGVAHSPAWNPPNPSICLPALLCSALADLTTPRILYYDRERRTGHLAPAGGGSIQRSERALCLDVVSSYGPPARQVSALVQAPC